MVRFQVLQQSQLLFKGSDGEVVDCWFDSDLNENYGWLDSARIFCSFDSRKTRLDSTQTFYGSAFTASAAAPRSTTDTASQYVTADKPEATAT